MVKRLLAFALGLTLLVGAVVGIASAVVSEQQGYDVSWSQGASGSEVSAVGFYTRAEDCAPGVKPFGQVWLGTTSASDTDVTVTGYLGWVQFKDKNGTVRVVEELSTAEEDLTLLGRPASYKIWDAKWKVVPNSWIAGTTSDDFVSAYYIVTYEGDGNQVMLKTRGGCNG